MIATSSKSLSSCTEAMASGISAMDKVGRFERMWLMCLGVNCDCTVRMSKVNSVTEEFSYFSVIKELFLTYDRSC